MDIRNSSYVNNLLTEVVFLGRKSHNEQLFCDRDDENFVDIFGEKENNLNHFSTFSFPFTLMFPVCARDS